MKVRIHRGTREIGGTCIEVEAQGKRIALDVGLPLDAPDDASGGAHERLLPAVSGFREPDDNLLGVVISHPHMDHYGLARYLRPSVPVYIGEAAHRILKAASAYVPNGHAFEGPRFIGDRVRTKIGPFRITPYLVDHSAFDAYSLLLEADGKRVFYSGDFRAHGRKSRLFEALIANPPASVDVLMMEGTTIGRTGTTKGFASERDLENEFVAAFGRTRGIHFVWASAQNIDRIVTVYRAAKRTGRVLVVDLYAAVVLRATGRESIPQSYWDDVRVYVPYGQRRFVKESGLFADLEEHSANRIFPEELPTFRGKAVVLFRPMMVRDFGIQSALEGAALSYSMWQGYLRDSYTRRVVDWLEDQGIPWETIHTSGHASVADLRRFSGAIAPRKLVPIHSFETGRFAEFFANVVREHDGVWWEV